MAGDEGEMSAGTEVLFSDLRWSSGMGSPSLPAHRDPPVSLAPLGVSHGPVFFFFLVF